MFEDKKVRNIAHELHEFTEELEEDIEMLVTQEILEELRELEDQYQKRRVSA